MKRLILISIAILNVFVAMAQCSIVKVGDECMTKNNFALAKKVFESNGLKIDLVASKQGGDVRCRVICDLGDETYNALLGKIEAVSATNHTLKQIMFLAGSNWFSTAEQDMMKLGYKLKGQGYETQGNGASLLFYYMQKGEKKLKFAYPNGRMMLVFYK